MNQNQRKQHRYPKYKCPRCGYETEKKAHMIDHFKRQQVCPCTDPNNPFGDLTNEIKEYVLANRQYTPKSKNQNTKVVKQNEKQESNVCVTPVECERFYQKVFESYFNGGHLELFSGITDITTNDSHIEIKELKRWKDGVGQLVIYNAELPKSQRKLIMFGTRFENYYAIAELICRVNIQPFYCCIKDNIVILEDLINKNIVEIQ